ncbi:MAG: heme exporter protein CcmB, partial [Candidatus Kapabacteria bacterium]|nr:heme exporter protein CcmB [Candidatus Kapabacteria bacterium]
MTESYRIITAYRRMGAHSTIAVFRKDLRSELRTRASLSAVLLFVVCAVMVILFSTAGEKFSNEIAAALLWIVLFFSAMTGMAKSFVTEQERGTGMYLRMTTPPLAVYFGKLLYNIILALAMTATEMLLFAIFFEHIGIGNPLAYFLTMFTGSIAVAVATTLISAIIATATTKNALFPVVSLPIILPLVFTGGEA